MVRGGDIHLERILDFFEGIASYLAGGRVLCDLVDDGARVEVALVHVAHHEHNVAVVVNQLVC